VNISISVALTNMAVERMRRGLRQHSSRTAQMWNWAN